MRRRLMRPCILARAASVAGHSGHLGLGRHIPMLSLDVGRGLMPGSRHAKDAAAAQPELEDTDPEEQDRDEG